MTIGPEQLKALIRARQLYEVDVDSATWRETELGPRASLTSRMPPVMRDGRTGVVREEDGAAIGMNLSARMLRYLGHPEGYGQKHPWLRSMFYLGEWCRHEHPSHYHRREWRGSLCRQLVRLHIIRGMPVHQIAQVLRVEQDRAQRWLVQALQWIEDDMERSAVKAERKRAHDNHRTGEGLIARFEREHDEKREARAWNELRSLYLRRDGKPLLPAWPIERERRWLNHREKGCPICARAA